MIIRKLFKYEMSHRVYGAYTRRCSHSIHGHSYKLEFLFKGNTPDNAQMVMDFGYVKKYFHPFIDAFDHAHMIWHRPELDAEIEYILKSNERYIIAPFSSTAEMQAKMFLAYSVVAIKQLKKMKIISNDVNAHSCLVHETETGYAEYNIKDFKDCNFPSIDFNKLQFSLNCKKDWSPEFLQFYNDAINLHPLDEYI
jgi:6-pyruvoyltetrahydropterin/6-carboxytetrahydropterin synthase